MMEGGRDEGGVCISVAGTWAVGSDRENISCRFVVLPGICTCAAYI